MVGIKESKRGYLSGKVRRSQPGKEVPAIHGAIVRQRLTCQMHECGEHIQSGGRLENARLPLNDSWPIENARHPMPAFPGRTLPITKRVGIAYMHPSLAIFGV